LILLSFSTNFIVLLRNFKLQIAFISIIVLFVSIFNNIIAQTGLRGKRLLPKYGPLSCRFLKFYE